jgi:DNA polymerase/3'-5' exonuclease PolX
MDYYNALSIAETLVDLLAPACKRIEIAGSIRRQKPDPNDIEIVAIPDLRAPRLAFGFPIYSTMLDAILGAIERGDEEKLRIHFSLNGPKFKQFAITQNGGQSWPIKVDLFLVTPPADWGVLYLIRTGPAEFSHWIVTQKWQGGGLPNGYRVQDGRVLSYKGDYIPCAEEIDFLRFCGMDWIAPSIRHPLWSHPINNAKFHQVLPHGN